MPHPAITSTITDLTDISVRRTQAMAHADPYGTPLNVLPFPSKLSFEGEGINDADFQALISWYKNNPDAAVEVTRVNLKANALTVFPEVLGTFPNLKVLDLSENSINRIPQIPERSKLKEVLLRQNQIRSVPNLPSTVEELNVAANPLTTISRILLSIIARNTAFTLYEDSDTIGAAHPGQFTPAELRQHFKLALRPSNLFDISLTALLLALPRNDRTPEDPLIKPALPAVLNARILSFIFEFGSLEEEERKLAKNSYLLAVGLSNILTNFMNNEAAKIERYLPYTFALKAKKAVTKIESARTMLTAYEGRHATSSLRTEEETGVFGVNYKKMRQ